MKNIRTPFTILALSALISACGGGDDSPPPGNTANKSGGTTYNGTVNINWEIPTTKTDGSPISLSELGGYRIYVSTNSNSIPSIPSVDLKDGTKTQYSITDLPAGTYYISLTSYDVNGDESAYSNKVQKTIL